MEWMRTQTHVGPLLLSETLLFGVSKLILLFGRFYDETKEGRLGKNGILILGGGKLLTIVILLFVIIVCLSHVRRARGFHAHFKSLLKDNVWSRMGPADPERHRGRQRIVF